MFAGRPSGCLVNLSRPRKRSNRRSSHRGCPKLTVTSLSRFLDGKVDSGKYPFLSAHCLTIFGQSHIGSTLGSAVPGIESFTLLPAQDISGIVSRIFGWQYISNVPPTWDHTRRGISYVSMKNRRLLGSITSLSTCVWSPWSCNDSWTFERRRAWPSSSFLRVGEGGGALSRRSNYASSSLLYLLANGSMLDPISSSEM